ncbi:MAG: cell division protein ZapA [Chlorobi bacterium]|nr:cell division protein ZapA [Chlorobiota bacterium]
MSKPKELVKVTVEVDNLSVEVQVPQQMMKQIEETAQQIKQEIKNLREKYGLSTEQALLLITITTIIEKKELEKNLEEYSQFIQSVLKDIKNIVND